MENEKSPLTQQLSPPSGLTDSVQNLANSGKDLSTLVLQMGNSQMIENIPPQIQNLFLNEVQPYSRYLGQEGQNIIYAITYTYTDIIKLSNYIQHLSDFLTNNLDKIRNKGFHPILHFMVTHKFETAETGLETLVQQCVTLSKQIDDYHLKVNDFINSLNQEIGVLQQGSTMVTNEYNQLTSYMSQLQYLNYWEFCREYSQLYYMQNRAMWQSYFLNNPAFNLLLKKQILYVIEEFKTQAGSIVSAIGNITSCWDVIRNGLKDTISDLKSLSKDFPNTLKVLTTIHLNDLKDDWKLTTEKMNACENMLAGSNQQPS